jgi:hypothetical protein
MGNYVKITDFAVKDSLLTGNPLKLITGTAHDNEYNAISTAIATKVDFGGALGTPSSGTLTNCTGLPLSGVTDSTTEALGVGSLELGHATDTTLTRASAGVVAIEGVNILTTATGAALAGSASQTFDVAMPTATTDAARAEMVSFMPSVASAATVDIFGAAGATIDLTGTTTVTGLTACLAAQVGSTKTVIPSNASGVSFTASANMIVDGATSGTFLMPQNAIIEVLATSTTTFKVQTVYAEQIFTPYYELVTPGTSSFGTYAIQNGIQIKRGRLVTASVSIQGGTFTLGTGSGNLLIRGFSWTQGSGFVGSGEISFAQSFVTNLPQHVRGSAGDAMQLRDSSYASTTSANCGSSMRIDFVVHYTV